MRAPDAAFVPLLPAAGDLPPLPPPQLAPSNNGEPSASITSNDTSTRDSMGGRDASSPLVRSNSDQGWGAPASIHADSSAISVRVSAWRGGIGSPATCGSPSTLYSSKLVPG